MKIKFISAFCLVTLMLCGCTEDYIADYCPANDGNDWLSERIRGFKRSDQKAEVYYYEYKGEPVFSINSCVGCADAMTVVYNCDQGVLCEFGGIAGLNTCPDWSSEATNERLIFRN